MKTKLLILTALFALGSTLTLEAQRLGKIGNSLKNQVSKSTKPQKLNSFKSTIIKKIGSKEINVPYTNIHNFLDYMDGSNQENVIDEEKKVQVYVWIPVAANEMGLRMVSPVGKTKAKNAVISKAYEQNIKSSDTLDVSIVLEKSNILNASDISEEGVNNATWKVVDSNQNAKDMLIDIDYTGNTGYTSERYITRKDEPLSAISRGLYRVNFKAFKSDDEKGTFLGQIGFPVKIPGIIISKDIEELKKKLNL
ncbi:LipL32 family surface lipoprotein [Aquimarina sp. SS2-1]|uniref:LipL32 family surface lipoprotein n=1 Tax=Aquimarina besae TaxID=3342247 RepID=UPI0036731F59